MADGTAAAIALLQTHGTKLDELMRAEKARNEMNIGKINDKWGQALVQLQAVNESIKTKDTQLKVLAARCDALGKEVETLKKDSAGGADIAAVKKLIADLSKRVDGIKK
jgi:hypothetical protein